MARQGARRGPHLRHPLHLARRPPHAEQGLERLRGTWPDFNPRLACWDSRHVARGWMRPKSAGVRPAFNAPRRPVRQSLPPLADPYPFGLPAERRRNLRENRAGLPHDLLIGISIIALPKRPPASSLTTVLPTGLPPRLMRPGFVAATWKGGSTICTA